MQSVKMHSQSHPFRESTTWVQEFAVGVVSKDGQYRLIDSGALPEAVAASAAIPFVFEPVNIPGMALKLSITCCGMKLAQSACEAAVSPMLLLLLSVPDSL